MAHWTVDGADFLLWGWVPQDDEPIETVECWWCGGAGVHNAGMSDETGCMTCWGLGRTTKDGEPLRDMPGYHWTDLRREPTGGWEAWS